MAGQRWFSRDSQGKMAQTCVLVRWELWCLPLWRCSLCEIESIITVFIPFCKVAGLASNPPVLVIAVNTTKKKIHVGWGGAAYARFCTQLCLPLQLSIDSSSDLMFAGSKLESSNFQPLNFGETYCLGGKPCPFQSSRRIGGRAGQAVRPSVSRGETVDMAPTLKPHPDLGRIDPSVHSSGLRCVTDMPHWQPTRLKTVSKMTSIVHHYSKGSQRVLQGRCPDFYRPKAFWGDCKCRDFRRSSLLRSLSGQSARRHQ